MQQDASGASTSAQENSIIHVYISWQKNSSLDRIIETRGKNSTMIHITVRHEVLLMPEYPKQKPQS